MKKVYTHYYIVLSIMMLMSVSEVWAQQTFRVYKKDKSVQAFFFSSLDSITMQSTVEGDEMGDWQLFHTPDSVYKIPINEIDSVSFATIPTIYKSGVIRIEEGLLPYVIGADSLTLRLSASTPSGLIPTKGAHVVTLQCSDRLPYGFFGKTENVTRTSDGISVECSRPSLTDIFESLNYEVDVTSQEEGSEVKTRAGGLTVKDIILPTLSNSVSFRGDVEAPGGLSQEYAMSGSLSLSTPKFRVMCAHIIERGQSYFTITTIGQHALTINASLASKVKWELKKPIEAIRNIRIPGLASLFELFEEIGLFVEFQGEIGLNANYVRPFNTVFHFACDNFSTGNIPPTLKIVGGNPEFDVRLEGKAEISVGAYGTFGLAPCVKEISEVNVTVKGGITYSSDMSLTTEASSIETINTKMYDDINTDDFYRADCFFSGGIEYKLFDRPLYLSGEIVYSFEQYNPVWQRGAVPKFSDLKLEPTDKAGEMEATTILSRKLLFPATVGFGIYDSDEKLVDKWWSEEEYKSGDPLVMKHSFSGLEVCKEYTLHPLVRAFEDNMVANPSITGELEVNIETGEASSITHESAEVSGICKELSILPKEAEYGVCYVKAGESSGWTFVKGVAATETNFKCSLKDLTTNQEYSYRAYVKVGEEVYYGEVKSFMTKGNLTIITGPATMGETEVVLCGYIDGEITPADMTFGFYYGNSENPIEQGEKVTVSYLDFTASIPITDSMERLYFCAYACQNGVYYYGEVSSVGLYNENMEGLLGFYESTGGENWKKNSGWDKSKPLDYWYGVSDHSYGLNIRLENNNLSGDAVLNNVDDIYEMDLSGNALTSFSMTGGSLSYPYHSFKNNTTLMSFSFKDVLFSNGLTLITEKTTVKDVTLVGCSFAGDSPGPLDFGNDNYSLPLNNLTISNCSNLGVVRNVTAEKISIAGWLLTLLDATSLGTWGVNTNAMTINGIVNNSGERLSLYFSESEISNLTISNSQVEDISIRGVELVLGSDRYTKASEIGTLTLNNVESAYHKESGIKIKVEGELSRLTINNSVIDYDGLSVGYMGFAINNCQVNYGGQLFLIGLFRGTKQDLHEVLIELIKEKEEGWI